VTSLPEVLATIWLPLGGVVVREYPVYLPSLFRACADRLAAENAKPPGSDAARRNKNIDRVVGTIARYNFTVYGKVV